MVTITNNSKAPQGIHSKSGLVFIAPGKTREVDIADSYVERAKSLPFLTVEHDAKPAKAAAKDAKPAKDGEPEADAADEAKA